LQARGVDRLLLAPKPLNDAQTGGSWEAKTALGHRAQKSEVQFLAFPIDLLVS